VLHAVRTALKDNNPGAILKRALGIENKSKSVDKAKNPNKLAVDKAKRSKSADDKSKKPNKGNADKTKRSKNANDKAK